MRSAPATGRQHSCCPRLSLGFGPALEATQKYPILGYCSSGRSAFLVEKSIYSEEYSRLCTVLRTMRRETGLTQVQVAAALDVPQSFVSKYESGERRLDVIELGHVAQALGCTARDVLKRLEEAGGSSAELGVELAHELLPSAVAV
jgi:DNA-binding XRE family transcriptional regulator